jgi:DNA polymerase-1
LLLWVEENMIKAFQNNEDIHKSTASKVFNVPLEEVTREQRSQCLRHEFRNYIWGFGFDLSNQTNLSRSECFDRSCVLNHPQLKSYISSQVDFARDNS